MAQPSERSLYRQLLECLRQGPLVRATVVATWGSTPREVGAKMLVLPDGQIRGTVGGGCGEAEVWQVAQDVLQDGQARRIHVDLTDPVDSDDGKVCGGRFDVYVDRWNPTEPAVQATCKQLDKALAQGQPLELVTYLGPTPERSWKRAVAASVSLPAPSEWPVGNSLAVQPSERSERLPAALASRLSQQTVPAAALYSLGQQDFFVDPLTAPMRLVIAGAGHIARPLCEMSSSCGYQVTIVDDREEYARPELFPSAFEVRCQDFTAAFAELHWDLLSAAVLVTRGHKHDEDCLRALAGTRLGYLGMIGSRRRVGAVLQDLIREGVDPDWLDSLHAPIGLDIGAQTPEEIAVCILAEMIQLRRGRTGRNLRLEARSKPASPRA